MRLVNGETITAHTVHAIWEEKFGRPSWTPWILVQHGRGNIISLKYTPHLHTYIRYNCFFTWESKTLIKATTFFVHRHTWTGRPLHISGFINRYKEQISTTSMAVRVLNLWPIINQTDNFLGTAFLCFNLEVCCLSIVIHVQHRKANLFTFTQGETLEGRLSQQLSTAYPKLLSAGGIYELSNYIIVPNNRKYKLTPQPYLIHINHEASVKQVEHKIPVFPAQRFSPLNFRQLIGNIKLPVAHI